MKAGVKACRISFSVSGFEDSDENLAVYIKPANSSTYQVARTYYNTTCETENDSTGWTLDLIGYGSSASFYSNSTYDYIIGSASGYLTDSYAIKGSFTTLKSDEVVYG